MNSIKAMVIPLCEICKILYPDSLEGDEFVLIDEIFWAYVETKDSTKLTEA